MSLEPGRPTGSKGTAWRAPTAVSVALLLVSGSYLLMRSRSTTTTPAREGDGSGGSRASGSQSPATTALDVTPIAGTWRFASITGVAPELLPRGAVPDNRSDIVIRKGGSFRWGHWSGRVEGSGRSFAMFVTEPTPLRQRFDAYSAGIGLLLQGGELLVWLPDLGQDRDVDRGDAQEDIDSPDMAFRRARPASVGVP
jgi:hypothetical protein